VRRDFTRENSGLPRASRAGSGTTGQRHGLAPVRAAGLLARGLGVLVLFLWVHLLPPSAAWPSFLYKNYELHRIDGWDILCDTHVVAPGEHVYALLRLRGQIAESNLPEFLYFFRKLNPRIPDTDIILPGQRILIPLKKVQVSTLSDRSGGVVRLPLITIPADRGVNPQQWVPYTVVHGDTVHTILAAHVGPRGSPSHNEGLEAFRRLNPLVADIDLILAGQTVRLPVNPGESKAVVLRGAVADASVLAEETPQNGKTAVPEQAPPLTWLSTVLRGPETSLYASGVYHFPSPGKTDLPVDLGQYPVLRLPDNRRVVFCSGQPLPEPARKAMESFWGPVQVVTVPKDTPPMQLATTILSHAGLASEDQELTLTDHGVQIRLRAHLVLPGPEKGKHTAITWIDNPDQTTRRSASRYLAERGIVVLDLLADGTRPEAPGPSPAAEGSTPEPIGEPDSEQGAFREWARRLGCEYAENVPVTFPYAGFQVTTVSNFLRTTGGSDYLVDFGTLYGDAPRVLRTMGLPVLTLEPHMGWVGAAEAVARTLGIPYTTAPVFYTANRPEELVGSLTIPGVLLSVGGKEKILATDVPLDRSVQQFLEEQGVRVICRVRDARER